jgi:sortase A
VRKLSLILILLGLAALIFVFGPVLKQEMDYRFNQMTGVKYSVESTISWSSQRSIYPTNTSFSIVIPKLNATAPIIDNVDPYDSTAYLKALKEGVAHAAGTAYPGEFGNVYLFAHSTDAFYNVGRYNAVFFLIGHLTPGDEIDIFYRGNLLKYFVYDKKVVEPTDTEYLGTLLEGEKTLTLQTCYPPGTTIKRLVVLAKLEKSN